MLEALKWMVRCVRLFEEFPHPLTGQGPRHLVRLTGVLGMAALDQCWRDVTGSELPPVLVAYAQAQQGQDVQQGTDNKEKRWSIRLWMRRVRHGGRVRRR